MAMKRLAVLGGGAWGTALADLLARQGSAARLWARNPAVVADIAERRENRLYLPGQRLHAALAATGDLAAALQGAEAALVAVPTQHLRAILAQAREHLPPGCLVVLCCKGIERDSGLLPHEVLAEVLGSQAAATLSGPTFAHDVAAGLPAAATLAIRDQNKAEVLGAALGGGSFRPYFSRDLIGVELGGALKNVVAIACGVVQGAGLGESAKAALLTRGLAEMARLAAALGAERETLMGLSGIGDLALTCGSPASRNTSFGLALGQGRSATEVLAERRAVTEGVATCGAALTLAARHGVEMPIAEAVDALANRGADLQACIEGLLRRPLRAEKD